VATRDGRRTPAEELQRKVVERTAQLEAANEKLRARNVQQSALAALGRTAIGSRDLGALLSEAAAVAAQTLGTEYSGVLERLPAAQGFRVRAGVGWKDGVVGSTVAEAEAGDAAHMLRSDAPVVTPDLGAETRFDIAKGLRDHGVLSAMGVVIRGRSGPWGTLSVQGTRRRAFSEDEVGFLQSVANVLALAIERNEVEIIQQKEQEALQALFDTIPVMITFRDESGRLLRANREWERRHGWTVEEAQRVDILAETYPDRDRQKEALEFMQQADHGWADFKPRTRDGRLIDTSWTRLKLSDGSRLGIGVDITERKRAEEALAESEARFARLFQASPVALGMSTVAEGRIIDVNQSWLELFGYRREEVIGRTNRELSLTVDPRARDATVRLAHDGGIARNVEMQVRRRSGEVREVIVSAVPVALAGEDEFWISATTDITERKRAEEERGHLLESESAARAAAEVALERLRAIDTITDSALVHLGVDELLRELLLRLRRALDADSIGVLLLDEDGKTLYPRAVDGYIHENFSSIRVRLGAGVTGRIAAEGRPMIVDDYSTIDASGIEGVAAATVRALTRSVMGAPLRIAEKVMGVVMVVSGRPRRFTEEELKLLLLVADRAAPAIERARLLEKLRAGRERQKALARRLLTAQEEERRRLAVELHDELGQILTAVKINLGSLERLSGASPSPSHLREAIGSVDRAMQSVRDLALDLRPSVLDDLGLPAALRWYVDRFARDANVEAHLAIDVVLRLEPELETACFRVAQEALTNVARHARARHVWLSLHLAREGLELSVRDDGMGFDVGAARERAGAGGSIGLLGMQERVSLLRGDFEVRRAPEGGAEIWARFAIGDRGQVTA
jgi:PAS domain S-box-containing protein